MGNLATGGTGKTPMTELLIGMLREKYKVATISRGYKRKTKGFAIADETSTALDIGDEPMQLHLKFPGATIAVGEERLVAVPQLLHDRPETDVIILDDAFQHRSINAGLNILLTDYNNLYTRDFMLPAGDLRDVRSSACRAQIIIVTKCPSDISGEDKKKISKELKLSENQQVFFTEIAYAPAHHLFDRFQKTDITGAHSLLICGIANPKPLQEFLTDHTPGFDMIRFGDHHIFKIDDLHDIIKSFNKLEFPNKIILTTEKDAVRLTKYETELRDLPIYVLPMVHRFLFSEADKFHHLIEEFIKTFNNKIA